MAPLTIEQINESLATLRASIQADMKSESNKLLELLAAQRAEIDALKAIVKEQGEQIQRLETAKEQRKPTHEAIPDLRVIMADERAKELKKNNVIIFNLAEVGQNENDTEVAASLFSKIGVNAAPIKESKRIRSSIPDKPRPLIVTLHNTDDKRKILRHAKKLRDLPDGDNFNKAVVKPDLTKLQQNEQKALIIELKRRRASGEQVAIKHGRIVPI